MWVASRGHFSLLTGQLRLTQDSDSRLKHSFKSCYKSPTGSYCLLFPHPGCIIRTVDNVKAKLCTFWYPWKREHVSPCCITLGVGRDWRGNHVCENFISCFHLFFPILPFLLLPSTFFSSPLPPTPSLLPSIFSSHCLSYPPHPRPQFHYLPRVLTWAMHKQCCISCYSHKISYFVVSIGSCTYVAKYTMWSENATIWAWRGIYRTKTSIWSIPSLRFQKKWNMTRGTEVPLTLVTAEEYK